MCPPSRLSEIVVCSIDSLESEKYILFMLCMYVGGGEEVINQKISPKHSQATRL